MRNKQRVLVTILMIVLLAFSLAACDADGDDAAVDEDLGAAVEGEEVIVEEETGEEADVFEEDVVEPDVIPEEDVAELAQLPSVVEASTLIGYNVIDSGGAEIAEVSEILFDLDGNIQWIILSVDELADTDLTPVRGLTWDQIAIPANTDVANQSIVLDSDLQDWEESLELDDAPLESDDLFFEAALASGAADVSELDGLLKLSAFAGFDLLDYDLKNLQGEDIGEVEQLYVDLNAGQVEYALADVGGFLGLGETPVLIPWNQMVFGDQQTDFFVNADQTILESAPTVDLGDPAIFEDDTWDDEIATFWETEVEPATQEDIQDIEAGLDTAEEAVTDDELVEEDVAAATTMPDVVESETLIGWDIVDAAGTQIAEVEEVLFDANTGNLQWMILNVNEFADAGAAPYRAFTWDQVAVPTNMDVAQQSILLDSDLQDWEEALELDDAPLEADDLLFEAAQATGAADLSELNGLVKMSAFAGFDLLDYDLKNLQGEDIGEVEQLYVDLQEAQVRYALADVGGFLGLGETPVLIPWNQMVFGDQQTDFFVNADQTILESAPTVDLGDPAIFEDDNWDDEIATFWETEVEPATQEDIQDIEAGLDTAEEAVTDEDIAEEDVAAATTMPDVVESETLIGWDIADATGTQIAEVEEVLFDVDTGNLQWMILDVNEFADAGASPYRAFTWDEVAVPANMDAAQQSILLDSDLQDWEEALEIDDAPLESDDLFFEAALASGAADLSELDGLVKMSAFAEFDFFDYDLRNLQDEDLGEIEQVLVDLQAGQVQYALADVGGFLGLGETQVLIPWQAMTFGDNETDFFIDANEDMLQNAPAVDLGDPTIFEDEAWDTELQDYWGVEF